MQPDDLKDILKIMVGLIYWILKHTFHTSEKVILSVTEPNRHTDKNDRTKNSH